MMVKRGPQLVQVMKKYSYRGFLGSRSSARHSLQMAMSGGMIEPESSASSELFQIVKSLYWFAPESSTDLTVSICASGGFFCGQVTHESS